MRAAVAMLLSLAGCDPVWSLKATVVSPNKAPLPAAALAITCPPSSIRAVVTHAALTDARGDALLGGGASLPPGCVITVARPGYRTYTVTLETLCAPKPLDDCYRARRITVVLEPSRRSELERFPQD